MDLGAPIGTHTSYTGQGQQTGLTGNTTSSTPIADKFTSSNSNARQYDTTNQTTGQALQDKAAEILTGHSSSHQTSGQGYNTTSTSGLGYDNSTSGSYGSSQTTGQNLSSKAENLLHGNSASGQSLTGGDAVSGQYAGGGVRDALTGESHAQRTGAGVGPLGENLGSGAGHHHHHHHHDNTATGITGAGVNQGQNVGNVDHHHHGSHHHDSSATGITNAGVRDGESYGTGVGAAGGAGGHYSSAQTGTALGAGAGLGAAGAYEAGQHSSSRQGENYGTSGQTGDYNNSSSNNNNNTSAGGITGGQGHYGKASDGDFNRGAPLSKDLDTGNPHSLVFQESTGKYVHRRDL